METIMQLKKAERIEEVVSEQIYFLSEKYRCHRKHLNKTRCLDRALIVKVL